MGYGAVAVEKARQIIELLAEGSDLALAAAQVGLSVRRFNEVAASVGEIGLAYTRAQECRMLLMVDEAKRIADDPDIDPQRARNQIDIRKWTASRLSPRVFGDRIEMSVVGQLSINDALAEAHARALRPMSDQGSIIDAQVIEQSTISDAGPADTQSDAAPAKPPVPDIFS